MSRLFHLMLSIILNKSQAGIEINQILKITFMKMVNTLYQLAYLVLTWENSVAIDFQSHLPHTGKSGFVSESC